MIFSRSACRGRPSRAAREPKDCCSASSSAIASPPRA